MTTHPNRSPLYQYRNYDPRNDTQGGYLVIVRADGTLRIELENRCWQGSITGTTWIVPAPESVMRNARLEETDDEAPEMDALIEDFLATEWQSYAKRIRLGQRVG